MGFIKRNCAMIDVALIFIFLSCADASIRENPTLECYPTDHSHTWQYEETIVGGVWYTSVEINMSFNEAVNHCNQIEDACTLASILKDQENSIVAYTLQSSAAHWIGGFSLVPGHWYWIEGDNDEFSVPISTFYWEQGEPSGNGGCITTHTDGKWYDDPCDAAIPFVCMVRC